MDERTDTTFPSSLYKMYEAFFVQRSHKKAKYISVRGTKSQYHKIHMRIFIEVIPPSAHSRDQRTLSENYTEIRSLIVFII
jgi:hypothetical protein